MAVIALFFWFGAPLDQVSDTARSGQNNQATAGAPLIPTEPEQFVEDYGGNKGLQVAEVTVGTGDEIQVGKVVAVHYVGRLADGTQFDSSVDRGQPLAFVYGQGQLIKGFEEGLSGSRVGSVRRIIIPSDLGYGASGVTLPDGTVMIPPNATLVFDVTVVSVGE